MDKGNHGQVVDITPDPDNPGKPTIHYRQIDNKGNQIGPRLGVKPEDVEAVSEKARLEPVDMGQRRTELDVDFNEAGAPDEFADAPLDLNTQSGIDLLRQRVHGGDGSSAPTRVQEVRNDFENARDAAIAARGRYQQQRRDLQSRAETAYLSGLVADQQHWLDELRRLDRAYIASRGRSA